MEGHLSSSHLFGGIGRALPADFARYRAFSEVLQPLQIPHARRGSSERRLTDRVGILLVSGKFAIISGYFSFLNRFALSRMSICFENHLQIVIPDPLVIPKICFLRHRHPEGRRDSSVRGKMQIPRVARDDKSFGFSAQRAVQALNIRGYREEKSTDSIVHRCHRRDHVIRRRSRGPHDRAGSPTKGQLMGNIAPDFELPALDEQMSSSK